MSKAINERVYWYAWYNGFALGGFFGIAASEAVRWFGY